jgi:hypothetical protein
MHRLISIAPFALLSTACAVRTPATALDAAQDDSFPATREVTLPSDAEAIAGWQLPPQNPWANYEKLTLLTYLADTPVVANMPDVTHLEVVRRAEAAATRLGMVGIPQGTAWIVDLRGAASVAFGATLSRISAAKIAPVLTFNNWPAEEEVVPAEQTLAALVSMRPRLLGPADQTATPVFLLDAWRLAYRETQPDPEAMDNRYMLLPSDFPDAATLRAQGITRVVYMVEDRGVSSTEEDDFHEVALAYQDAGVDLCLVDLGFLERLGTVERWDTHLASWHLRVWPRATIFDNSGFYTRARGGFGAPPGGRIYAPAHPGVASSHTGGGPGHSGGRAYSGASPHTSGHGGG